MAGETCNHIRISVHGRSPNGGVRRAVAAAAYRAGQELEDQNYEMTHDYSRRRDVWGSFLMVPEHMKNVEWANDREQLWNAVETKENESRRAATAQLFREVIIT